ncbi:MAG: hypothetical protein KAQ83_01220 [Nanoarchaeota archaeon]|nr:hypothetical protein [Nanoarchaeota archaeon]
MAQGINLAGIGYGTRLALGLASKRNMIPHVSVTNMNSVDPEALYDAGIRVVCSDVDNTWTAPKEALVHHVLEDQFENFKCVFGYKGMILVSNSAGTIDDKGYTRAEELEQTLGLRVLRHGKGDGRWKKPANLKRLWSMFQSYSGDQMAMLGDRILTDVVWGNRLDMLTIHSALLTEEGDNPTAAKIRKKEFPQMVELYRKGVRAPYHPANVDGICTENLLEEELKRHTFK